MNNASILYVITQSKYGGAQKYVLQLVRHFKEHNTVTIAVGEPKMRDEQFFKECADMGITPLVVASLQRDISFLKSVEGLVDLRKLFSDVKPDIIHLNSSMAGAVGSVAAWILGFDPLSKRPAVVYTAHGFVFNEPMPRWKKMIYKAIEQYTAPFKQAIIAVSEQDRKTGLENRIASSARLTTIHNGINPDIVFLDKIEARDALTLPHDATVVGTVASLYPTKNITCLIEAACELVKTNPGVHFVIIGDGPENELITKKISESNAQTFIHRIPPTGADYRFMRAFDIFVLPSIKEGLPYTILEAGLAGVPVVATNVGGIPEIITDDSLGVLVPPNDPLALSSALQRLLSDNGIMSSSAEALGRRVRDAFSEKRMIEETEKIYDQLIAVIPAPESPKT